MSNTMFFNLLLNIGLLVLIATMLTKLPMVRSMLLEDSHAMGSRAALAVIFGLVSIFSTYTGVRAQGAIVNTRVIGVLAAGLLGGPYVGIGAAVIGGLHRYLFDIGGFTAVSCAVSTFVEGLIGSAFSKRFKAGKQECSLLRLWLRLDRWLLSFSSPAPFRLPWTWYALLPFP